MRLIVKALGLLFILLTCTLAGFLKAYSVSKTYENLRKAISATRELAARIKLGGEIGELISLTFGEGIANYTSKGIILNRKALKEGELKVLEELFSDIGMRDLDSEYNRTISFAEILEKRYLEQSADCKELCRLYKSVGLLGGVFLCIFFL